MKIQYDRHLGSSAILDLMDIFEGLSFFIPIEDTRINIINIANYVQYKVCIILLL